MQHAKANHRHQQVRRCCKDMATITDKDGYGIWIRCTDKVEKDTMAYNSAQVVSTLVASCKEQES